MTDTQVYCCDSTDCFWNHDNHCSCSQIEVNKDHICVAYILKELAEQAIAANMEAEHK